MIVVLGSINLDIVMRPARLPGPGETVLAPGYATFPGGKGANQALAARRAGANVAMAGCVGDDDFAAPALASMRDAGIDLTAIRTVVGSTTGAAAIAVDDNGENLIIVASGANQSVAADQVAPTAGDWLLLQMEIPFAANWDALAAARAGGGVVDQVAFDDRVAEGAGVVVASEVEPFPGIGGVVDLVVGDPQIQERFADAIGGDALPLADRS